MRFAFAVLPLALALGACNATPVYQDPRLAAKVDRQRITRDNCLLSHAPQLDNGGADVRGIARAVAAACSDETEKLLALSVPYPDAKAREGYAQEAVRRAADIVVTFRGGSARLEERRAGEPTPLTR
jgi:hypothetical protein